MPAMWMTLFSTAAHAQDTVYGSANGPLEGEALAPHIAYLLDSSWEMTIEDIIGTEAKRFKSIPTIEPDFGYTDNKIWLRINLKNTTSDINNWRLYVRENFLQHYSVYLLRQDGVIEQIESQTPTSQFSDRALAYPELVTPINFSPNEEVSLYINYWSGGSSHAAISLETQDSFATISVTRMSKIFLTYGMLSVLILAASLATFLSRKSIFWVYLAYLVSTLIYLMHIDGLAFQYLWPNSPRLNSNFSILIGTAYVVSMLLFSRVFLRTKTLHPKTDKCLLALIIITVCVSSFGLFIDPQSTKQFLILMLLISIIAGIIAGIIAAFTRFKEVRFYLFAWVFGVACATLVNMRHIFGFDIAQDAEFDSLRISIVVDAIMMGLSIADRLNQISKARRKADQENLATIQLNLDLNNRLHELEDKYNLALELGLSRDQDIQNTLHDLQQPLHALRLNILNFKQNSQEFDRDKPQIDQTFDYLETLINGHLQNKISASLTASHNIPPPDSEDLQLPAILQSIHDMFMPDATAKGLEFRFIPCRSTPEIEPLIVMRIISNLVANAINYTQSGKLLLGCRLSKTALRIEVHDTGIGLSAAEFTDAKQRHKRLNPENVQSGGHGFGLNIADELAQKQGYRLYRIEGRQNGTSLGLKIPIHAEI